MSETSDWRGPASAEYRSKRADLLKKCASAAKAEQRAKDRREEVERQLQDLDAGARAFGLDLIASDGSGHVTAAQVKMKEPVEADANTETDSPPSADGQSAKQIILTALEKVYPKPLKAAELRKIIERELGRPVHYKTPGMTLYRLADVEAVRREGHNWYLAEPPARWVPEQEPDPDEDEDDGIDWGFIQEQEDRMMDQK